MGQKEGIIRDEHRLYQLPFKTITTSTAIYGLLIICQAILYNNSFSAQNTPTRENNIIPQNRAAEGLSNVVKITAGQWQN